MCVILHVGYPKTATTWLQKVVFPKHPELRTVSFGLKQSKDEQFLWHLLRCREIDFDRARTIELYPGYFEPPVGQKLMLTFEGMVGSAHVGAHRTARNARRLSSLYPDAKILICLRNQAAMWDSIYRQYVHQGGCARFRELLERDMPFPVYFSASYLEYDKLVQLYRDLFGEGRVHVCLYERLRESPRAFLSEMFSFMGVSDIHLDDNDLFANVNRGMSSASLRVMRFTNRFLYSMYNTAPVIPFRRLSASKVRRLLQGFIDPALTKVFGSRQSASGQVPGDIGGLYTESNCRLQEMTGLPLAKYGYECGE